MVNAGVNERQKFDEREGATGVEVTPSIKDILDSVGVETGLTSFFEDDSLDSAEDEDEAARDVARVTAQVRPLLQRYRSHRESLEEELSRAQATAASSTRETWEISKAHLVTFERLEATCGEVASDLDAGERSTDGSPDARSERAQNAHAYLRAEAEALASRHSALVERRRRMRSALSILEVSERARAALEASGAPGRLAERVEEAMKSIRLLRDLIGDNALRGPEDAVSLPAGAQEARGDAAIGELARVARGRVEWLTRRVREKLRWELADALHEADALAAGRENESSWSGTQEPGKTSRTETDVRRRGYGRVKVAVARMMALQFGGSPTPGGSEDRGRDYASSAPRTNGDSGGGSSAESGATVCRNRGGASANNEVLDSGAGWTGGAVWALDGLLEPVAVRFRFHFEEDRPTNRVDRPEWFFSFLRRAFEAYRPLLAGDASDGLPALVSRDVPAVDCVAYFARGLALLARRRLRAQLSAAAADDMLLSHTVEEALAFDLYLDQEAGYGACSARFPGQSWPRCVEVFAQDEARFQRWMDSDGARAEAKLASAADAPGAWQAVAWKNGPRPSTPVTPSAIAVCRIFDDVTQRYRRLRDPWRRLRFAKSVQEPILRLYRDMLWRKGNECRLSTVFRDNADDSAGATTAWAAALGSASSGGGQKQDDTTPIGRWRTYCLALSSGAYVLAALRDSEDDVLFAEMSEAAAPAPATGAMTPEAAAQAAAAGGGRNSLTFGAMGTAVSAAVDGVSQAATSVATSAETATVEVARAVGAQGSIIGPTHAITAALTSLKGAARLARRAAANSAPASTPSSAEASIGGGGDSGEGHINTVSSPQKGAEDGLLPGEGNAAPGRASSARVGVRDAAVDGAGASDARHATGLHGDVGGKSGAGSAEDFVFGEEALRYTSLLDAMMDKAVSSCRDGFLWRSRSYVRAWDRGIAVVIPSSSSPSVAEPSGRLAAGVHLLAAALAIAEACLPSAQFGRFWTALASQLDSVLVAEIIGRRSDMIQDEGVQLVADLKALMAPFSVPARQRPESHFPGLTEAALLLSLEKSQLRSLSSGLEAHGGGVGEAHRGPGWDGWREEGGSLSPEGTQMRYMLDNVGVLRLGPAEASLVLEKRLRGDRKLVLGHLATAADGVRATSPPPPPPVSGMIPVGGRRAGDEGDISASSGAEAGATHSGAEKGMPAVTAR